MDICMQQHEMLLHDTGSSMRAWATEAKVAAARAEVGAAVANGQLVAFVHNWAPMYI